MNAAVRLALGSVLVISCSAWGAEPGPAPALTPGESKHLANLRQVTQGLPRAGEGYFSADGSQIVYQVYPIDTPFYQIYTQPKDSPQPRLVHHPHQARLVPHLAQLVRHPHQAQLVSHFSRRN